MRATLRACALVVPMLLLAACVTIPSGPSVMALPGTGKSFDQFRADDMECRQYASSSIGGATPADAQAESVAKSAAVGTAVGALAGAMIGGRHGAGEGAGVGLIAGSAVGVSAGNTSGFNAQRRYDHAYLQCMYAKGQQIPTSGQFQRAPPSYTAPPPAYSPPPPPGYWMTPPPPPPNQ